MAAPLTFVDTGVFAALIDRNDQKHADAEDMFRKAAGRCRLVTTNAVIFETHALLLNRVSRPAAVDFLDRIAIGSIMIERVSEEDEKRAADLFRRYTDKTFSLCDCSSFIVMERLGIKEALSFDSDFRSYGRFTIIPPTV